MGEKDHIIGRILTWTVCVEVFGKFPDKFAPELEAVATVATPFWVVVGVCWIMCGFCYIRSKNVLIF